MTLSQPLAIKSNGRPAKAGACSLTNRATSSAPISTSAAGMSATGTLGRRRLRVRPPRFRRRKQVPHPGPRLERRPLAIGLGQPVADRHDGGDIGGHAGVATVDLDVLLA